MLRHIASITLLAVYMPMALLSSLHVHHDTVDLEDSCNRCAGHFESQHHHQSDCLYCKFLSESCLSQTTAQSNDLLPVARTLIFTASDPCMQVCCGISPLRAPPASYFHSMNA